MVQCQADWCVPPWSSVGRPGPWPSPAHCSPGAAGTPGREPATRAGPWGIIFNNWLVFPSVVNVSTKRLKWRLMLQQSMLRQILHVCVGSDTQRIQSSDWPKDVVCYDITQISPFVRPNVISVVWQPGCRYVNLRITVVVMSCLLKAGNQVKWLETNYNLWSEK